MLDNLTEDELYQATNTPGRLTAGCLIAWSAFLVLAAICAGVVVVYAF